MIEHKRRWDSFHGLYCVKVRVIAEMVRTLLKSMIPPSVHNLLRTNLFKWSQSDHAPITLLVLLRKLFTWRLRQSHLFQAPHRESWLEN